MNHIFALCLYLAAGSLFALERTDGLLIDENGLHRYQNFELTEKVEILKMGEGFSRCTIRDAHGDIRTVEASSVVLPVDSGFLRAPYPQSIIDFNGRGGRLFLVEAGNHAQDFDPFSPEPTFLLLLLERNGKWNVLDRLDTGKSLLDLRVDRNLCGGDGAEIEFETYSYGLTDPCYGCRYTILSDEGGRIRQVFSGDTFRYEHGYDFCLSRFHAEYGFLVEDRTFIPPKASIDEIGSQRVLSLGRSIVRWNFNPESGQFEEFRKGTRKGEITFSVIVDAAILRSAPKIAAGNKIGRLTRGEGGTVLGVTDINCVSTIDGEAGRWLKVHTGGKTGWIWSSLCEQSPPPWNFYHSQDFLSGTREHHMDAKGSWLNWDGR